MPSRMVVRRLAGALIQAGLGQQISTLRTTGPAWAGLALVVVRIGRTGDCRWWLAGGPVAGLGVADDHSMSFSAIALVIGALLSGGRRMIWNRWFAAGAVIAVAFEVPDLWWQALPRLRGPEPSGGCQP